MANEQYEIVFRSEQSAVGGGVSDGKKAVPSLLKRFKSHVIAIETLLFSR